MRAENKAIKCQGKKNKYDQFNNFKRVTHLMQTQSPGITNEKKKKFI